MAQDNGILRLALADAEERGTAELLGGTRRLWCYLRTLALRFHRGPFGLVVVGGQHREPAQTLAGCQQRGVLEGRVGNTRLLDCLQTSLFSGCNGRPLAETPGGGLGDARPTALVHASDAFNAQLLSHADHLLEHRGWHSHLQSSTPQLEATAFTSNSSFKFSPLLQD